MSKFAQQLPRGPHITQVNSFARQLPGRANVTETRPRLQAAVIQGILKNGANGTTTDFTRDGFGTPDAAIVIVTRVTDTLNPNAILGISWGFWNGTTQHCIGYNALDNVGATREGRPHITNRVAQVGTLDGSSNYSFVAQFSISNITDGVRLTLANDSTTENFTATVILIKGTTNKSVATCTFDGVQTTETVTFGFNPDVVFCVSNHNSASANGGVSISASHSQGGYCVGIAHKSSSGKISQYCMSMDAVHNTGTSSINSAINNDSIMRINRGNGTAYGDIYTRITAFSATGITVNQSAARAGIPLFLGLKLSDPDDFFLGLIDSPTSTGDKVIPTMNLTPTVVGVFGSTETVFNSTSASPDSAWTFGFADAVSQESHIIGNQDNLSVSNTFTRRDGSNFLNIRFHDDTVDAVASITSLTPTGINLNFSDAPAASRKLILWSFGSKNTAKDGRVSVPPPRPLQNI
jgi:hypothetical protein